MKDRDADERDEVEERPYRYFEQKAVMRAFHFYISGEIEEPAKYADMIHQIRIAQPNDAIHIHLNTPGGQVATGVQIINAIKSSQGHIITHLEGEVCSMGSVLFLAGDEMVVYDNCLMMFHNYSGGSYGKGHEITASVEAVNRWFRSLMCDVCNPFLSEDELDRIIRGEDIWMTSEEIRPRLIKMVETLEKEAEEAAKPKRKTSTRKKKTS